MTNTQSSAALLEDLFAAVADSDAVAVQAVLGKLPSDTARSDLVNRRNDRSWTPLHMAARYGFLDAVKTFVALGASTTALNDKNQSPIDLALQWNYAECASAMGWSPPPPPTAANTSTSVVAPTPAAQQQNFFAGNPLNRRSEVRDDGPALVRLLHNAKFIIFSQLKPVISNKRVVWFDRADIEACLPSEYTLETIALSIAKTRDATAAGASFPILVFLGEDEGKTPYWAVDATNLPALKTAVESKGLSFADARPTAFFLPRREAAILAQGRAILDWNARNVYCAMCGVKTQSGQGGYKRLCPTEGCLANKSVQNTSYPRTDPVIITCIVHADGNRILLGRQKAWPKGVYSCIAGFVEAGESLEEAACREAFEETSVVLNPGRVFYHSSQPWPFPSQLMVGMIGEATSDSVHFVDGELEDAKWFTREEVIEALAGPPPDWDRAGQSGPPPAAGNKVPKLMLPAVYAIARVLINAWANESFKLPPVNKL
ncbi:NUDIX hydrolase domain-like protein [Zopfochytrium polystomum]|nr:NUDIX hydrolase domain-like protein [Zopfochytrium polystomum]